MYLILYLHSSSFSCCAWHGFGTAECVFSHTNQLPHSLHPVPPLFLSHAFSHNLFSSFNISFFSHHTKIWPEKKKRACYILIKISQKEQILSSDTKNVHTVIGGTEAPARGAACPWIHTAGNTQLFTFSFTGKLLTTCPCSQCRVCADESADTSNAPRRNRDTSLIHSYFTFWWH